jgi:hypothetical protein
VIKRNQLEFYLFYTTRLAEQAMLVGQNLCLVEFSLCLEGVSGE